MNADELRELRDLKFTQELIPESTYQRMRLEAFSGKSEIRLYPYDDCVVHKTRKDSTDEEHERDMQAVSSHLRDLGYSVDVRYKFGDRDLGVNYITVSW